MSHPINSVPVLTASVAGDTPDSPRYNLVLCIDNDGRYRWFEKATGADTEVSGLTIEEAKLAAARAWTSHVWDLQADWL